MSDLDTKPLTNAQIALASASALVALRSASIAVEHRSLTLDLKVRPIH